MKLLEITKMKKTLLATAIPALLIANSVAATELYNDDVNSFSVGGHLSAGLTGSDEGNTGVNYVSPRINFTALRDMGNGFTADARVEWSINMGDGGDQALSTRLGYVGLTHDTFGRTALGTQWAPTYDVTGVADMPIAFANDFLYNDHGNLGTGRAKDMVSYRNGFEFGENMGINLGLGYQGAQNAGTLDDGTGIDSAYDARMQAALSFDLAAFNIGAAYNTGDINDDTATITSFSAKYGSYGQGLYVAAVYAMNENTSNRLNANDSASYYESQDSEFLVAYAFANSVNVSLNYENSEGKIASGASSETLRSQAALQVEYNFLSNVVGYVGYQVDLGDDITKDDNIWMIGGRVYL